MGKKSGSGGVREGGRMLRGFPTFSALPRLPADPRNVKRAVVPSQNITYVREDTECSRVSHLRPSDTIPGLNFRVVAFVRMRRVNYGHIRGDGDLEGGHQEAESSPRRPHRAYRRS